MSSSLTDKFEKMDLTSDELKRLTNAFEKEEFRKLFAEYAEEISNPDNRAIYENEIRELEKERGMEVKFVHPEPGYVLKTSTNGTTRTYINICKSDYVAYPTSEKRNDSNGKVGSSWSIPHLFSQPREDFTRNKNKCLVYDFVIHPYTFRMAETNPRFKHMINDIAIDGLQKMFNVVLDTQNCKQIKLKFKGQITSSVIRNRILNVEVNKPNNSDILINFPYPYGDETSAEKAERMTKDILNTIKENHSTQNSDLSDFSKPKYELRYQSDVDLQKYFTFSNFVTETHPQRLVVDVFLPLLNSASSINLDVFENSLKLQSHKPTKYHLELNLPYYVDENASSARFDKTKHQLTIVLTVLPNECFISSSKNHQFDVSINSKSPDEEENDIICSLYKESIASKNTSKEFCEEKIIIESHEQLVNSSEKDHSVLHGILKQSMSDPFEDQIGVSSGRSTSNTEYPEENVICQSLPSSFGSKKSVSFNNHIDQTIYQIHQSVSTLHATLKNKRKKNKKREQKHEYKKVRLERKKKCPSFVNMSESQEYKANKEDPLSLKNCADINCFPDFENFHIFSLDLE